MKKIIDYQRVFVYFMDVSLGIHSRAPWRDLVQKRAPPEKKKKAASNRW